MSDKNIAYLIKERCKDIEITDKDVNAITASCKLAGINDNSSIDIVTAVVDAATASHFNRVLAAVSPADNDESCPICKATYKEASLINGRIVKYCSTHRIALPAGKQ